ncbi:NAD-dependent epimerase/dehydratase family protein [Methylobacterium sp. J-048]|uniref:NAD-dependent epimerase/dehydratase family protein n=1 Tax=Methylobacterium sp. J-048 TaxID=2836635 RepID=UPI001FB98958|nr:NAD-dependent epimerase/dehydratase family protein [Methylobacterium sp. J-048]MCJ2055403.1 NAD-dependent epimerase/dehydratase family protein [Methylobacterium sp. J-048]
MAVLVTGASGCIGRPMLLTLLDAGHEEIVARDDRSTGFDWAVPAGVKRVVCEVADLALGWEDKLGTRNRI